MAYTGAVLFYCVGYIIVAASHTVGEVAGGEFMQATLRTRTSADSQARSSLPSVTPESV
jgi:hypothetical protein